MQPLVTTDFDLTDSPWGENEETVGLTPSRLLSELETAFKEKDSDCRSHWSGDAGKMPEEVLRLLPPTLVTLATFDILRKSGLRFVNDLRASNVDVVCKEFEGLHQVKDMDRVTEAGRALRQYVCGWLVEMAQRCKGTPRHARQVAMSGLDMMAS